MAATVATGSSPYAIAVNSATNKIYAVDELNVPSAVTVIDGATNSTTTVPVGLRPVDLAVNSVTNKIFVVNQGNASPFGGIDRGSITVIDGATNSTTTVIDPNANGPRAVEVNSVTNKIYVSNLWTGNVTVIDGATNSTVTVTDPNANGIQSVAVAVNSVTNKTYVANNNLLGPSNTTLGNITVIDGATNSTTTITDPNAITPVAIAVNRVTNKIYVANEGDYPAPNHGNVTVIEGATNSVTTVTDPNVIAPIAVAVNTVTNKIYVANANDLAASGIGSVTVVDGATNTISSVKDPNATFPNAVAVDSVTNVIYVANVGCFLEDPCKNPGSVTAINGATNAATTVIEPNAHNPAALALDPTTNKIYVANVSSANVTVINGGTTATSHILSLVLVGTGSGTITSSPAGIDCTTSCTASFVPGTVVKLTALPGSESTFSGWGTNCTGTGACDFAMTSDEFVTATFNVLPPDFSLQTASASLTALRGGQVTDVISIAPQNGSFDNTVQLSCAVAGPTPMPTCALSPTSVTPGANSATSTLTITAPGLAAQLTPPGPGWRSGPLSAVALPFMGLALIGFGVAAGKSSQRRLQLWLLWGLSFAYMALQAGCGGGSSGQRLQPQTYSVTVTATSGAIQHSTQATVTVQ